MKTQRYLVEITMPDNDIISATYLQDLIQNELDFEGNEGRDKVVVKDMFDAREEGRRLLNKVYPEYSEQIEEFIEGGNYTPGVSDSLSIASFEKFMENNNYFI